MLVKIVNKVDFTLLFSLNELLLIVCFITNHIKLRPDKWLETNVFTFAMFRTTLVLKRSNDFYLLLETGFLLIFLLNAFYVLTRILHVLLQCNQLLYILNVIDIVADKMGFF